MAGIKDYSTTQASNTDLNGISTAEGMLPSNLNNAIRALMKNTREWFNDSQWVEYGDGSGAYTAAYVSGTAFTIAGVDVTSFYHAGRRIKLIAATPGTIFGTISSSSFSTNTTVNVTWDSGSLSSEAITNVYIGALSKTNNSIPTGIIATATLADGSVTTVKLADDAVTVAKMAVNSVDSDQYVDGSIDTAHIASAQVTSDKIATNAVTTAKINADAVTSAKIGDEQIDSEHYVDGSIDTAHIADSQITVAKMAANSVDSDQYVDGSIDTAHIADSQITSAKIADDSIVNADINSSAAIDATKIADGTVTSAEFQYINTLSSNAQTQIDAKAATTYVDNAVAGLRTRIIAECATTANVNLSNGLEAGDAIDGVTLVAGDRVLVKNQSTASENGLYLAVSSGSASRDPEHDTIAELSGGMVVVNQGSVNDNKIFLCTTDTDATLDSTSITYTTITPQNVGTVTSITAGTGLSGGAITSSGTIAIDSTVATLAGTQTFTNKTLTSPKINEDVAVTSTATELNLLDGKAATNLALVGKTEGTNFTNSLLIGHATTGTLSGSENNTGVGIDALDAITQGDRNTAVGTSALTSLTTGLANTAIGAYAGESIVTSSASNNTAVGVYALNKTTGGNSNVAVGNESLFNVVGGDYNTGIGKDSGRAINTGSYNIAIGYDAGDNITTGSGNVIIGTVDAAAVDSARTLKIAGNDGSTTTTWITGDGSGVVTLNAANVTQQALTSSSNAVAWDASAKPNAVHITTENTTFSAPSNAIEGAFICVEINYNGSHSIAWNTVFEFAASTAPTFTSADGKTDIMVFRYSGAVWQEVGRTLNLSEA
jgi:hypothetical protein